MREFAIHHIRGADLESGRLRLTYRVEPGAQPQEIVAEFEFDVSDENRRLLQWYIEEYLLYPWGGQVHGKKGVRLSY